MNRPENESKKESIVCESNHSINREEHKLNVLDKLRNPDLFHKNDPLEFRILNQAHVHWIQVKMDGIQIL